MSITYQEAFERLNQQVYGPVFFNKLASVYGIRPESDEEADGMVSLGAKLKQAEGAELAKTAGHRRNLLAEANRDLDKVLGNAPAGNTRLDAGIKQAAAELKGAAELRDAALVYNDYLARLHQQA